MSRITILAFCLLLTTIPCFASEEMDAIISKIADIVGTNIQKQHPDTNITVTSKGDQLDVQWNVRDYQVYTRQMTGKWSNDLETKVGPEPTGCRLNFHFIRGDLLRQMHREKALSLERSDLHEEPYWLASYTLLELKDSFADVNISLGNAADKKLIKSVYNEIVKVAKQELGESDK